ncbi:MAG: discoidin domain-containing protein, partial [Thermodesulfobacteriota bacterium]|nr:discoidin domain-containing protein [Thermodesulfobacteriota bacterium]
LYVRLNQPPTLALWDCRPLTNDSNEYCSFNNPTPGTYYIMVIGYSGTSDYSLRAEYSVSSTTSSIYTTTSTTIITGTDTMPPTGTITINNGEAVTNVQTVILQLSAFDNGIPLDKGGLMKFSNDNQVWSDPEPFTPEKLWTLAPGDGIKTVFVLFADASRNWMTVPVKDDIVYEATQTSCSQTVKLNPVSITASSESLPFFAKENAIDGDPSTAWSTVLRFFQRDEFLTIDLGEVKNITSLSMYASRMFGTDFFPTNITIQVSSDSITWIDMDNLQGYSPPIGTTTSDNWNYNNLEGRYLKISISKCRIFLLLFKVAQIAEIEVYGCEKTDQGPILHENTIHAANEAEKLVNSEEENDLQNNLSVHPNVPSVPGKPSIRFHK